MNNSELELLLNKNDHAVINSLIKNCQAVWEKRHMFRTETEMRISVLNDGRHPTKVAKYWQSVAEQSHMYENLVSLSFEFRRHQIKIKQKEQKLQKEVDPLRQELIQIDLEELAWVTENMKKRAHHYVRELETWDQIIKELNDGSFDTENPDVHQYDWLHKRLENDLKCMNEHTSASEAINIVGLAKTAKRMEQENPKWLQDRKDKTQQLLENKNRMINS